MHALLVMSLLAGVTSEPYGEWVSSVVKSSPRRVEKSVGRPLSADEIAGLVVSAPPIPYRDVTVAVRTANGTVWAGSPHGLMRRHHETGWRLFHSRRWLLENEVLDLRVTSDTSVLVKTRGGVNQIRRRTTTLSKKMDVVLSNLRQRHVRLGLIGAIELAAPGQLQRGWKQHDDDNDGLWTSMYVAAEAFRFAATHDAKAREQAGRSLKALMFLESITGTPGYVARSVVPAGTKSVYDPDRWRDARDRAWRWKSDTSSDELCGHFFAYSIYYDLAATAAEKDEIRGVVGRIMDHIIDKDFYYIDPDGKRTTWGVWNPKELNSDPKWAGDRGLDSLELLSFLKVASHITGKPRYAQAARELIERHGYAQNTVNQRGSERPEAGNQSDDELAFLAYYPLLRYETDPKLREIYLASIRRTWRIVRPQESPLFNFIYAAALQAEHQSDSTLRPATAGVPPADYDHDICVKWFRDVPTEQVEWFVDNTGRNDASPRPFSVFERGIGKWNGSPFDLKRGGDGKRCDDGTYILLPYWMGVYHRFLD